MEGFLVGSNSLAALRLFHIGVDLHWPCDTISISLKGFISPSFARIASLLHLTGLRQ